MKKICLYRKENENDSLRLQGRYDIVIKELEVNQHYRNIRISWNIH